MPKPTKDESREDYIARFMRSDEARSDFPDDAQRAAVAYSKWKELHNDEDEDDFNEAMKRVLSEPAKPRKNGIGQQTGDLIPMRFIEPGLVRYADVGDVMVRKETLDRMARSFVGKPVFNQTHKEVTSKDFTSGRADGIITRVWFEPSDGWYWSEAMVWDPETKVNCRTHSVSCAYDVTKWSDRGGIHNNIPYEREVLDGEYTHMAVVANPRYEGARILYNTQGGSMKLAFWRKDAEKPEVRNASEVETDNATLEIDGAQVPLKEAIELWNSKKEADKKAAAALSNKLSDDDEMEVGGERVTVKNLKDTYLANRKNDDEEKKKEKEDDERKNAEAKEKEKEDEERKNAADKARKDAEDAERRNAQAAKERLKNAADTRNGEFKAPNLLTREDRVAEGASRYGTK